ncbi:DUF4279 domain-containing protein [Flavobacterium amniphilum]|uniref:DUF4279 domain-containing protein n=1 Tax=Flavobacterium amniphilum TaxID=1834035 RepID=UPI00202A717E|nr:DUF4279 domain-containing protein [Flavobacterium amniphilum]MCL9807646.1 DUF4279 domain-containing protein [Flavobacterium amniphilum]
MTNTTGYTYFAIKTENKNFGLDTFNKYLSIQPTRFEKMFSRGKIPSCTIWEYSSSPLKNPIYFEEIEKLVAKLNEHKPEFLKLKSENPEVDFVLQVVVKLGDETPGLSFSKEIIQFINDTDAIIDCDIYNSK